MALTTSKCRTWLNQWLEKVGLKDRTEDLQGTSRPISCYCAQEQLCGQGGTPPPKQVMDNKQVMRTSQDVMDKVDKKDVVTNVVVPKDSNIREKDE